MAFVTEFTFGKLASSFELNHGIDYITKEFFVKNIYSDGRLFGFFNQYNLKRLYNYKFILENHEELDAYDFVERLPDTKRYVFDRGGQLKYHLFDNCETLNSVYKDYIIPVEVQDNDLVEKYRAWFEVNQFKEKDESGEQIQELVIQKYNNQFASENGLPKLNLSYKLIQTKSNTGNKKVDYSFNLDKFHAKINSLIEYKFDLCCSRTLIYLAYYDYYHNKTHPEIKEKIMELSQKYPETIGNNFINNYGINNLINFWRIHHKLKTEVFQLLASFFRWTYKLDEINFNEYTLNNFGLRSCLICKRKMESNLNVQ